MNSLIHQSGLADGDDDGDNDDDGLPAKSHPPYSHLVGMMMWSATKTRCKKVAGASTTS